MQTEERQTYTVQEAGRILGLSKNSAYEAVRVGQIPSLKIGGKIIVPRVALVRLLAGADSKDGERAA